MLISNNIYQYFQSQFHELSDTRNKANLYQILVYDGSHFVNGTVTYLTEDELSKVITEIEQTHYCQVEPSGDPDLFGLTGACYAAGAA